MQSLEAPIGRCHSSSHVVGIRGGLKLSFILLEPVIYLQGDGKPDRHSKNQPAVSRGYLHLEVTKPTKIKGICVSFHGLARFQPLGGSTRRQDLITSGITYFENGHATLQDSGYHNLWEKSISAQEIGQIVKSKALALQVEQLLPPEYYSGSLDWSGLPRPCSESPQHTNNSRPKGHYTMFPAGGYIYPFEFLVHDLLPETISTELVSVHYYLEAKIEFPGIFRSQMRSQLDIPLLRLPSENSLELTESIIISKDFREQLHYDICFLGRSFPLGSRIPIRLKLTPFIDLKCCWLKVYVSQHMQYSKTGRETRVLQLGKRKVLLFEKQAGNEYRSTYPGSKIRITSDRDKIRPTDTQTWNLLGEVLETREIELQVQLPRCPELKEIPQWQRLHTSTKAGKPDVNHWIQIVFCLSKEDRDGTAAKKQNAFQLLIIETPITVLSCKATPSNIYVPPYAVEPDTKAMPFQNLECDCVGNDFTEIIAPKHKSEVPETEAKSVEQIFLDNLTRPVSFESSSSDIKPPAQAHI
ncbi:hypothetical protein N7509_008317, partial [Penicillium cosmopolitanum]